jgi:hypothetical protein
VLACRVFGHRYRFSADGSTMHWRCQRGCGAGGSKTYPSPGEASRYATALDVEDRADIGRRAPILGMFPLRLWRKLQRAHERR